MRVMFLVCINLVAVTLPIDHPPESDLHPRPLFIVVVIVIYPLKLFLREKKSYRETEQTSRSIIKMWNIIFGLFYQKQIQQEPKIKKLKKNPEDLENTEHFGMESSVDINIWNIFKQKFERKLFIEVRKIFFEK